MRLAPLVFLCLAVAAQADPLPGNTLRAGHLITRSGEPTVWKPGRTTIISFFAFWCDTWRDQCPRLKSAMGALHGLPIDLVTVSVDGRWSDVPGYDPSLTCLLDRSGWGRGFGVDRVPTTLIVDGQGTIRWVKSGVARSEDLEREARLALDAPKGGDVQLLFESFPPPEGGFELLDLLRRMKIEASFRLRIGVEMDEPLVKKALALGHRIVSDRPSGEIVDPFDSTRPGTAEIVRRVVLASHPGATVLLHAGVGQTVDALPEIVEGLRKRGLRVGKKGTG